MHSQVVLPGFSLCELRIASVKFTLQELGLRDFDQAPILIVNDLASPDNRLVLDGFSAEVIA